MAYLLDTDWIIETLAGNPRVVSSLQRLQGSSIAISWIAVAEVYEGAFTTPNPSDALVNMRQLLSLYRLLNLDDAIAMQFAQLRALLRRRGELIADMDLLIAATALTHDLTLLTFNHRHFRRVPDLKLFISA